MKFEMSLSQSSDLLADLHRFVVRLNRFGAMLCDDSGQGIVEYGLILMFCSILAIIGFGFFGKKSVNSFNNATLLNTLGN